MHLPAILCYFFCTGIFFMSISHYFFDILISNDDCYPSLVRLRYVTFHPKIRQISGREVCLVSDSCLRLLQGQKRVSTSDNMLFFSFGAFFPVLQPSDSVQCPEYFLCSVKRAQLWWFSHDKPVLISCHCHCGRPHRFADMDSLFLKRVLIWNFA
jgi:hypothetical protein